VQHKPEVLDIHSHLSSITNVPNGAYYKLQLTKNNKDDNPWIPLLPGYTIFTTCAGHYVKMSIDKDQEGQLWFCWTDYDNDASFLREYAIGRDQAMFSSLRDHLNLEGTYSVPSLLGFNHKSICTWLQSLVLTRYPTIFVDQCRELKAAAQLERSIRSAKKRSEQVAASLDTEQSGIQAGVMVNQQGIIISGQESQALVVMNKELQNRHKNDQRVIKKLKANVAAAEEQVETVLTPLPTSIEIDTKIDTVLATAEVGSTIVVDTRKYIFLVLSKACKTCFNANPVKKTCQITRATGLSLECRVTCSNCGKAEEYSNEPDGVDLSMCAAVAGIAGAVNRYALSRVLATLGVTKQPSRTTFHKHQQKLSPVICQAAKQCAADALQEVLRHLQKTHKETLSVSFDVSWSHVRNATEASGEFIFQGKVPGKLQIQDLPCYACHTNTVNQICFAFRWS
jgi:hypothetical protein